MTIKSLFKYCAMVLLGVVLVVSCGYLYLISKQTQEGDITWQSCYRPSYLFSWFILPPPLSLQCATVSVPVDYTKPNGKSFDIALTRLPSKQDKPIGHLLMLNGGPGGHSLDMSMFLNDDFGQQVKDNFHVIGYAPRGITPTTPAISCGDKKEESDDPRAYMQACIEHTGKDVLPFISSKEVVKDLDVIRQKLHAQTWSMVGYSYGTKLVAKYAEHYPTHLRAGVVDGVVDTAESLFTILINHSKSAQIAFEAFIKHCHASDNCVFDATKEVNQNFLDTIKAIGEQGLVDRQGNKIDGESILSVIDENLNNESEWSDLVVMLDELKQGKTSQYDTYMLMAKFAEKSFSDDALVMVNCADSAPRLSRKEYIAYAKLADEQSQYDNLKPKSDDDYLDACFYWPWEPTDDLNENLINEQTPNLLFVSHQYDLATPFANAKTMAKRFDDPLIYVPSHGHGVSLSGINACVDDYVVQYLLEPKTSFKSKLLFCP